MAGKFYERQRNSFGEQYLVVTSPSFPARTLAWLLCSIAIGATLVVERTSFFIGPLIGLIFSVFNTWVWSKIEIKHDLVHINSDSPNRMNRHALNLNKEMKVEERLDKNPFLARRIGIFNDGQYATLQGMGTSRNLTPRGVLVLAELQRYGATISFPGFSGRANENEDIQPNLADRMHRIEAFVSVFPMFFILALLIPTLAGQIPWILPSHYLLGFIPLLVYFVFFLVFYVVSFLLPKKAHAKTTYEGIEICLEGRLKQEVPWHDIKQVLITVHPTKFWFESVSVNLVTHYNRTHTLVNRELTLVRGALDIIDLARSKGIGFKVVYQDTVEEEDVFLDIKPQEKPLPREQITPAAELNQDVVERA